MAVLIDSSFGCIIAHIGGGRYHCADVTLDGGNPGSSRLGVAAGAA